MIMCPRCKEKRLIGKVGHKTYFCRNCLTEFKEDGNILPPIYQDESTKATKVKISKKDVILKLLRKGLKPTEIADKTGYNVELVYSYRNTYRKYI